MISHSSIIDTDVTKSAKCECMEVHSLILRNLFACDIIDTNVIYFKMMYKLNYGA